MNIKNYGLVSTLVISISLFFAMPVLALSDNFSNYANNYLVLDNTAANGWIPSYDTTSIKASTLMKNDGSAFQAQVNTLSTSENRASVHKSISPKNISSFITGKGKLYMWYHPTQMLGITSVRIRLESSPGNYYEYSNSLPFGISFVKGAQLISFDLAKPIHKVGNLNTSAVSRIQIITNYLSLHPNFDFSINRVWVEKNPNAFGGKWVVPLFGGKPGGWALPYSNSSEGNGMSLASSDISSMGYHGRVYYRAEPTMNDPTFTVEADVRIVSAQWGARLFFDFIDGANFSSVFLTNQYNKVGVETYINGVRTYSQVPFTITPGKTYTARYVVNGTQVSVFVNDTYLLTWNVPMRRSGEVGFESFKGTSHFSQFTYS